MNIFVFFDLFGFILCGGATVALVVRQDYLGALIALILWYLAGRNFARSLQSRKKY